MSNLFDKWLYEDIDTTPKAPEPLSVNPEWNGRTRGRRWFSDGSLIIVEFGGEHA